LGVICKMEKKDRPEELRGTTTRIKTECGNLYVIVSINGDKPYEVFAHLGKAGGCSNCQNEALTRAITLGLRYGIPVKEFVGELEGIQCPNPTLWPKGERVLSCPDGIAKVLKGYCDDGDSSEGLHNPK